MKCKIKETFSLWMRTLTAESRKEKYGSTLHHERITGIGKAI